jgi:hypothetical protein
MGNMILDGTGHGFKARVDGDHRLRTYSKSASIQHVVSEHEQEAYQVIGTATLSSGTVTVLHIKNISSDTNMVVTYLRHQVIEATGGTSFPNASNYFSVRLMRTYSSGGSTATPVNVFGGSGNTAEVTCYQNGPTLVGTAKEIDRWYTKADGDMNTFNKEGALLIPPNQTMEVSYVGDRTGGTVYARISFIMGS